MLKFPRPTLKGLNFWIIFELIWVESVFRLNHFSDIQCLCYYWNSERVWYSFDDVICFLSENKRTYDVFAHCYWNKLWNILTLFHQLKTQILNQQFLKIVEISFFWLKKLYFQINHFFNCLKITKKLKIWFCQFLYLKT